MFQVAQISTVSFNITSEKSVTYIGYLGGSSDEQTTAVENLSVPWHDLKPDPLPFSLLSWNVKLSEFSGRSKELRELTAWASSDRAISVKFITGVGGVGKSRLAAHFSQSLADLKWAAGFVDLRKSSSFPLEEEGTLLIVDYPEECIQQVEELLNDLTMLPPRHKIRILFLTRRNIDDWLQKIHDIKVASLVDTRSLAIEGMESTPGYEIYSSTLEKAADALGTTLSPLTEEQFDRWMNSAPENRLPLFIMATAVHSAMYPKVPAVQYTGKEVVKVLADREIHRLRQIAKGRGEDDDLVFARLSAMAAVTGGFTVQDVTELAGNAGPAIGFRSRQDMETYLRDLEIFQEGCIPAPKPNIAAAAFTTDVLGRNPEIAPSLLWTALATNIEGSVNRIARLSYDSEIILDSQEGRMSSWLVTVIDGDENYCRILEPFFADFQLPMGLTEVAVAVYRTLLMVTKVDHERARLLNNLSIHLRASGDDTRALEVSQEAVEVYRRLTVANPEDYEFDLAGTLNNLANSLRDKGDETGSIKAIQEAVDILKRLAEANPARFEPELAGSLSNLSNRLRDIGDKTGSIKVIQEAVDILLRLAKANPAHYEPDLARCLDTMSITLSDAGDNAGALGAIQEAVDIFMSLAEANPARYEPDLARSLDTLSIALSTARDNAGALEAIQQALDILRRLAEANPDHYEPDLARSLITLSNILGAAGDNTWALEAVQEAVDVRRRLAVANPARYEPHLVDSLNTLSDCLSTAGDNTGALEAIQEALDILRRLAEANPLRFEPHLVKSYGVLGAVLLRIGRDSDAIDAFQEGIHILRLFEQKYKRNAPAELMAALARDMEDIRADRERR